MRRFSSSTARVTPRCYWRLSAATRDREVTHRARWHGCCPVKCAIRVEVETVRAHEPGPVLVGYAGLQEARQRQAGQPGRLGGRAHEPHLWSRGAFGNKLDQRVAREVEPHDARTIGGSNSQPRRDGMAEPGRHLAGGEVQAV